MIPLEKVKQIVSTYETLEKELVSGDINKKDFANKSKGYSSIREVINQARSYLGFEKEKAELEKIIEDKKSDKDMIELAKNELIQLSQQKEENENSVDTNYTLTTNFNAVSAGPVTVASGVTVTIPAGQAWVIV